MMRGRFLSLEGVEGVGKSTNLGFVIEYLQANGIDVVQTREPGGSDAGEAIREVLLNPAFTLCADTELLLMYASRAQLVQEIIKPALEAGQWVVSDRFSDASFAYQGGGRNLGMQRVAAIDDWVLQGFKPDCTLFLDLAVEKGMQRIASRGHKDRIEQEPLDFFRQVRSAYHQRVEAVPQRFKVVDAGQPLDTVQGEIADILDLQIAAARHVS